jgi:hypothetical protein
MNFLRAARFPTPYNFEVVSHPLIARRVAGDHDLRVYYQVQIWIGGLELDVCEFG